MTDFSLIPLENRTYVKSNDLVSAKFASTLLEKKICMFALARLQEMVENQDNPDTPLDVTLFPGEVSKLISDPAHIYRDLKAASKAITGRSMIIEDGKGNFTAFAQVTSAEYIDGTFTLRFNPILRPYLLKLSGGFTSYRVSVMASLDRNSSFRLYELLKKDMFRSNPKVNNGRVDIEYNLFEFRFLIGLANIDNTYVKNKYKNMSVIDWEELYHTLEKYGVPSDIKYKTTDKLQKDCIRPAQEEIAEKSDIRFEYELRRIGRSYKRILFHIYPNTPSNKSELLKKKAYIEKISGYQYRIPRDMTPETQQLYDKYVGHNDLVEDDINFLFKYTDSPKDIAAAIDYVDSQKHSGNYMGYIVDCIRCRYFDSTPIEVEKGSKETADKRRAFNERVQSPDVKKKVWEKIKEQKDFDIFLDCVNKEQNLSFYELDELLDAEESSQIYINWRKTHEAERMPFRVGE